MDNKLKKLFDYQRFEKNEKLEKMILETKNRYVAELLDDDLSLVSAAGEAEDTQVGGIIGHNDNGTIDNSYNNGGIISSSIGTGGGCGGEGAGGKGTAM